MNLTHYFLKTLHYHKVPDESSGLLGKWQLSTSLQLIAYIIFLILVFYLVYSAILSFHKKNPKKSLKIS